MDETRDAFAYRCLPLNIANAHGWEIVCPVAFSAKWNGGAGLGDVDIRSAAESFLQPASMFGHGVLTFHVNGLFRTDPGWNLFASGPPNSPKDGIYPLSGVIETDWAPYTFTMNWRFTRPDHWISFDEGEPFCFVFPVQRGLLDKIEPEFHLLSSAPDLQAQYEAWSRERNKFSDRLTVVDSAEQKERWQKRYYRGLDMREKPGVGDHEAKLRLPEFVDKRPPSAVSAEQQHRKPLPIFFRKVVELSRIKHAKLGLVRNQYGFAATTSLIPLVVSELAHAAPYYPIAFSANDPPRPFCVVGALPGINQHVNADGNWRPGYYIPVAVRRYPFITIVSRDNPNTLILGIDETATQLDPSAPDKLFSNGEMTALCRDELEFCAAVATAFEQTDLLFEPLTRMGLLMPSRNVTPGRIAARFCMSSLRVIDPERLAALPEATRATWKANGLLAVLEAQVASARNWEQLLALEDAISLGTAGPSDFTPGANAHQRPGESGSRSQPSGSSKD
ncbi:hypothetical protein FRZ44_28370 [Hypericibacter terrae]|uniref:SapC family protein n=2 Tax=Hypericibacter terrae TaxID=2602015 RepID=A0A5J6MJU6_9PROT|nr:hypothetical protein FRZ44_28370 [Hypericibacter terrae]